MRALPLGLVALLTSTMMYGAAPYTIASTEGGPVKDELGEIVSMSESEINQNLAYEAVVIDTTDALHGSLWQIASKSADNLILTTDAFPIGSKTVTVKFTVKNKSIEPMNVYGLFVKGWYESSKWLASPVTPTSAAKHVEMGYPEHLVDYFGLENDEWIILPQQSVSFAETFYIDNEDEPLNLELILPQDGEEKDFKASARFQLHS